MYMSSLKVAELSSPFFVPCDTRHNGWGTSPVLCRNLQIPSPSYLDHPRHSSSTQLIVNESTPVSATVII